MKSRTVPSNVLRAVAYVRVSHIGKQKDTNAMSSEMQLDEARRYCEFAGLKFNEPASRAYADLDVSGFRKPWRQRPGLMALFEAAKRGEIDCVVFYKISRLARNVREALDLIAEFEKLDVSFHFVAEKIDSGSAQGRFLRNVLLSAAEMQSEDASSFLKSACERRAREGRLQGGALPVWVCRDGKGYGLIPEQVTAIRRLVELRFQGLGYTRIAKELNLEGFRTVNGKYWTPGMAYKYVQPTYVESMRGTGLYGRYTADPIRIPGIFPPILSEEEADRLLALQKLYSEDYGRKPVGGLDWAVSKRRKLGRRSASTTHLLSGIVFCPHCERRLVASQTVHGEVRSHKYTCPASVSRQSDHPKWLRSVSTKSLEDAVLTVIRAVLVTPPPAPAAVLLPPQKPDADLLTEKIDRLVSMHLDGKLDSGDFTRLYAELTEERDALRKPDAPDLAAEHHRQAMNLAGKEELSREELRQLVLLMVERVDAPFKMEGVLLRDNSKALRTLARIHLRFPTASGEQVFLAGLYTAGFTGPPTFVAVLDSGEFDRTKLIAKHLHGR